MNGREFESRRMFSVRPIDGAVSQEFRTRRGAALALISVIHFEKSLCRINVGRRGGGGRG